uniref:HAT C-terminal dimerisation domain-containing protein n=1 Tax=Latimeria chalumnae TaxID=7897 RepID=H3A7R8_LATCH
SKKISSINARGRCAQYPKHIFHESGSFLFCSTCNVLVDYSRKASYDKHLQTTSHKRKVEALQSEKGRERKVQKTVSELFEVKTDKQLQRWMELFKLTEAFCAANVPLKTVENVNLKEYLECNLKNVGIIPSSSHLQQFYLPRVFGNHVTEMKEKLKSCNGISTVTDKTTDAEDRYVFNILGVLSELECEHELKLNVLLLDCVVLDSVNFKTVSQAIQETLDKSEVPFDRITAAVSDNATYMKKAWERSMKPLFLNAVHVTCVAHLLNLVDDVWCKKFVKVNDLVVVVKRAFTACPALKAHFCMHLEEKGRSPCIPPIPVITCWNTWFNAALFHLAHVEDYISFFEEEKDHSSSLCVADVIELCQSPEVLEELNILQKYAPAIMHTLTKYEESVICSHIVSNDMCDLIMWAKNSADECEHAMGREALLNSAEKIETYIQRNSNARFCQPAAAFFNACQVFDPNQVKYLIIPEKEVFEAIPLFEDNSVAQCEYRAYLETVYKMQCENVYQFWRTLETRFPTLAVIAIRCLMVPVNSVDAERSFSAYKNVLQDDWRSIKASNLSMYNVLCQNKL